jgi:hypothetical protein
MADLAKQRDDISGAVETTGAAGVYAMTPNATATHQTTGLMVRVQINHDSPSGGCTFNYGGKGAKAIKVIDSAGERDPNANELKQNAFCTMTYDAGANSSAGAWIATDIVTAALDTSNFALRVEAEGTKASAATCDIGSVTEYRVKVTGTTAITSFGSVANSRKLVRFTAALTLTHNATSLILPGGANITTAAGDVAEFASDGSGNWRCVSFMRASGAPADNSVGLAALEHGTEGDILFYGPGGAPTRLGKGDAGQALRMNAGATAPSWEDEVFKKVYESAELSITASSDTTLSHGLGAKPNAVWLKLICKTAEHGYSVGDEYPYPLGRVSNYTADGIVCKADDTQLKIRIIGSYPPAIGRFDGTYDSLLLTAANWKMKVRAAL